jgi:hypothetical protein
VLLIAFIQTGGNEIVYEEHDLNSICDDLRYYRQLLEDNCCCCCQALQVKKFRFWKNSLARHLFKLSFANCREMDLE